MIKNSTKIKITLAALTSCLTFNTVAFATNFNDIEKHWGKDHIVNLTSKSIINGYSDNTFRPNNTITRSEFSKLISTALKVEDNNKEEVIFPDIEKHWAEKKIEALANRNIIDKSEYEEYKANENITRIEIAKMAVRALNLDLKAKEITKNTDFKDDDLIKKEDKGYVILAVENKIVNGYTDETFRPDATATRAEASKMIVSLLEAIENQKDVVDNKEELKKDKTEKDNKNNKQDKNSSKDLSETKEVEYQSGSNYKVETLEVKDVIKNVEGFRAKNAKGIIKMEFPEHYKFEFKDLEFEGKTYIQAYCDEFIDDGYESGYFLDKDLNITNQFIRIGGFKSDLFDVKNDFRPYFSFGLKEDNLLEKAEYIAFVRDATYHIKGAEEKVDEVLVVFENPFKKN